MLLHCTKTNSKDRMIAVIADDFTGAAEIGGVGLRHGLSVIIETKISKAHDVDLLIIATNTRALTSDKAAIEIARITEQLLQLNPGCIFKKLDSVLRGNIISELKAQSKVMKKQRAIVVAGNPSFGRLIINGKYYVNDTPLHETFFAHDPEFPVTSNSIRNILSLNNETDVYTSLHPEELLPSEGIILGDISNVEEVEKWVEKIDASTIPAGGALFFNAILSHKFSRIVEDKVNYELGDKVLFVFGSAVPKDESVMLKLKSEGVYFSFMPREIYLGECNHEESINKWSVDVSNRIKNHQRVVVAVSFNDLETEKSAMKIQKTMSILVESVIQKVHLEDLLIEGGSTSFEIFNKLGIKCLYPFQEIEAGVIQMKTEVYEGMCITTKPGSYSWPEGLVF